MSKVKGTKRTRKMDVLFLIDSTQSMSSAIQAAHNKAEDLAFDLSNMRYRDVSFRFGCICYRDPVDSFLDVHQFFDFDPDIENLSVYLGKVEAFGGGDIPEDFVGAIELTLNKLSWDEDARKGIIWIADAPAHGKRFCGEENHQEEEPKLEKLVKELAEKKFYFSGISINGGVDQTFAEMKKIFDENGGKSFRIQSFSPDPKGEITDIEETLSKSTIDIVDDALKDF
ncbi:hypothetical protein M9Y10_031753 [Tritrichomonas musculus]|uniref:VWFA domain-containing protein n=1 Tax=Tritrichomonas musculus TaxID=1915356 RepID=A0ABR2GZP7_9EUKA